jgi:hypothetical protein
MDITYRVKLLQGFGRPETSILVAMRNGVGRGQNASTPIIFCQSVNSKGLTCDSMFCLHVDNLASLCSFIVNQPNVTTPDGSQNCAAGSTYDVKLPLCPVKNSEEPGRWIQTLLPETYCQTSGMLLPWVL